MRLATVLHQGAARAAVVAGDRILLLHQPDLRSLLTSGLASDAMRFVEAEVDIAEVRFLVPVPEPEKVICVGLNFRAHAKEAGYAVPDYPTLFAKYSRSLIGAYDDIVLPPVSKEVDWEAELGVIIGRPCRYVSEAVALDAIAGYTVVNDISMRDWQMRTPQFLQGKTFERSTPVGPYLVTPDEIPDPNDLPITCEVNGEVMQHSTTADMIFSPAQIVAYISQIITLVPGDIIACGTPSGIGGLMNPPRYLKSGDVVTTSVGGLGELSNSCSDDTSLEEVA